MYLLYCDETNLEERKGDFFVYGGVAISGAVALDLSRAIENIRNHAKVDRNHRLKFNPCPTNISHQEFIMLKQDIIEMAIAYDAKLLVSVILHDIATNPNDARRNGINTICFHFDCLLNRYKQAGLVLIDRFSDAQIDAHVAEKMSVGVTGMPYSSELKLSNLVGFHYAAIGQSHFSSFVDIVLGSLRFSINAFTRNEKHNLPTARRLLELIIPLFVREPQDAPISEISFSFSPKVVKVDGYRQQYQSLKEFLAEGGIKTMQEIQAPT